MPGDAPTEFPSPDRTMVTEPDGKFGRVGARPLASGEGGTRTIKRPTPSRRTQQALDRATRNQPATMQNSQPRTLGR